jgi:glycosidase
MKKRITFLVALLLLSGILLTACKKNSGDTGTDKPVVTSDYTQYGTPFKDVPDPLDATIYQVNIRCFSKGANFAGVTARLDSIKSLGINVIYLMPIFPVGELKSVNSPYCVKDYKGINPDFGTLDDLRTLIDGAHSRNMAVILDWVANHTSWDNDWIENDTWYKQDDLGNIVSPSGYADVAQLNFDNHDMIAAMIKAMKYWVYNANCDGFRCDFADNPPYAFWKEAIDSLHQIETHKLLLLAEGTRANHYSEGFNYTFGFGFYGQLKKVFNENASVATLGTINTQEFNSIPDSCSVVRYITNHDVNSSDGTPLALFGGKPGSMTAFVIAAYMKGIPMVYNGQEINYPTQIKFPFTTTTIDWTINRDGFAEYKKVLAFRNGSKAIKRGALRSIDTRDVCAFTKTFDDETVLVIANVRAFNVVYPLPSDLVNSTWQDGFAGTSVNLGKEISLQPYSYLVLKK